MRAVEKPNGVMVGIHDSSQFVSTASMPALNQVQGDRLVVQGDRLVVQCDGLVVMNESFLPMVL